MGAKKMPINRFFINCIIPVWISNGSESEKERINFVKRRINHPLLAKTSAIYFGKGKHPIPIEEQTDFYMAVPVPYAFTDASP